MDKITRLCSQQNALVHRTFLRKGKRCEESVVPLFANHRLLSVAMQTGHDSNHLLDLRRLPSLLCQQRRVLADSVCRSLQIFLQLSCIACFPQSSCHHAGACLVLPNELQHLLASSKSAATLAGPEAFFSIQQLSLFCQMSCSACFPQASHQNAEDCLVNQMQHRLTTTTERCDTLSHGGKKSPEASTEHVSRGLNTVIVVKASELVWIIDASQWMGPNKFCCLLCRYGKESPGCWAYQVRNFDWWTQVLSEQTNLSL